MPDTLFHVTHSKVQSFFRCRKQYRLEYLETGLARPPEQMTLPGIIGKGVHEAMRVLCETGEPASGAHVLEVYLRMPSHAVAGPGTDGYAKAFQIFEAGCAAHASIESEDRWAEKDTWVPMKTRGITVRAQIDRIDRFDPLHWQVIDWKTGMVDRDDVTDAQLDLGQLAARTSFRLSAQATVTAIAWNLRSGQKRVRELRRVDAAGTMRKYADIADRMRTTESFEATPGPYCNFCRWREQCDEAEEASNQDWDVADPDMAAAGDDFVDRETGELFDS